MCLTLRRGHRGGRSHASHLIWRFGLLSHHLTVLRVISIIFDLNLHFCFPFVGTVKDLKSIFVGGVDALSSNLHE